MRRWGREQLGDRKRPVSLEIERASERGLGFISVKHCCIYRYSLKRFPAPFSRFPLLHFQLAPDGWSNAIRSNYSSHVRLLSVCPRLCTGTHSSGGKVSLNSVQLLRYHPFIPPPFTHSSSHWSSSIFHCPGAQSFTVPLCPPTCLPTRLLMTPSLQLHTTSTFLSTFGLFSLCNRGRDTHPFSSLSKIITANAHFQLSSCSLGYHPQKNSWFGAFSSSALHSIFLWCSFI